MAGCDMCSELFPKAFKDFFGYNETAEKEQILSNPETNSQPTTSLISLSSTIKCYVAVSSGQRNIPYRINDLLSGAMDVFFKNPTSASRKPSAYFMSHYPIFPCDRNLTEREFAIKAGLKVCGKNTAYVLAVSCSPEELKLKVADGNFSEVIVCAYNAEDFSSILLGLSAKQFSQLETIKGKQAPILISAQDIPRSQKRL
jgi:hypothetical protein